MGKFTFITSFCLLILSLILFDLTNFDIFVQDFFYSFKAHQWLFNDPSHQYHLIFYTLIKVPIYLIGIFSFFRFSYGWKSNQDYIRWRPYLIIFLTLVIVPSSIALIGKNITNIQCPYDINRYGGGIPYTKYFEHYPSNPFSKDHLWMHGHCWPAGHCSGGFALMSLVLLEHRRIFKILYLLLAIFLGIIMASYQTLRGAHFLSHTVSTFFITLIIISILNLVIKKNEKLT